MDGGMEGPMNRCVANVKQKATAMIVVGRR